jgi:hypothetical protein
MCFDLCQGAFYALRDNGNGVKTTIKRRKNSDLNRSERDLETA